jgi:hypothetical protein
MWWEGQAGQVYAPDTTQRRAVVQNINEASGSDKEEEVYHLNDIS